MNWLNGLKAKILSDEPICRHTTLRIGPAAGIWVEPSDDNDARKLLIKAKKAGKRYLVVGCGSKLLIKKKKIPLAVHLNSAHFKKCAVEGSDLIAGAGVGVQRLIKEAYDNGLGGLEFLSGIPASVGGAIMLNAGISWPKRIEIGAFVHSLWVIDENGRFKTLDKKDLEFDYRLSNLRPYIILSARFGLFKKRKKYIKLKMQKFLAYRRRTQELGYPSAGCIFKNPNGHSAGKLIDLCGLKGRAIGGAQISSKHANFIINRGNARPEDIMALMKLAKRKVRNKFKVNLEPEIQVI
jgi:UDP-N-acetylmuramate dehydrogenase